MAGASEPVDVSTKQRRIASERSLKRGAVCVNCASTDLRGVWVVNHPDLPSRTPEYAVRRTGPASSPA